MTWCQLFVCFLLYNFNGLGPRSERDLHSYMKNADEGAKLTLDVFSNYKDSKDLLAYKDCKTTNL